MSISYAQAPLAVAIVTTTELVAAVLPLEPMLEQAALGRVIRGFLNILAGTGTTALVVRVRQGNTIAGTLVGTADTVQVTAGNNVSVPFSQVDTGVPPAGNQYCVTIQQTAATANGTVNDGAIEMDVPSPGGQPS